MKTKLVYVLTCAPEATFIEQALMAIWSAHYHNPDAHIVLIVDDKTDVLLTGKRAEILNYISEKIVVPFEADKDMHYRSRWLKTSLRELISGDFLYIDCDTIIARPLSAIDDVDAEIAMIRDENVDFADEIDSVAHAMIAYCKKVGVDLAKEKYYFNGGVIYAKDTPLTHRVFDLWHTYWQDGLKVGLNIDQPSFAKANIACGRPVILIPDKWNTIASTYIEDIYHAYILHFWRSVSFLYNEKCMRYIKKNGLNDLVKYFVLHPTETFIPSDTHISYYKTKDYCRLYTCLKRSLRAYGENIDSSYEGFHIHMRSQKVIMRLLVCKWYAFASLLIVLSKWYKVHFSRKFKRIENVYKK